MLSLYKIVKNIEMRLQFKVDHCVNIDVVLQVMQSFLDSLCNFVDSDPASPTMTPDSAVSRLRMRLHRLTITIASDLL